MYHQWWHVWQREVQLQRTVPQLPPMVFIGLLGMLQIVRVVQFVTIIGVVAPVSPRPRHVVRRARLALNNDGIQCMQLLVSTIQEGTSTCAKILFAGVCAIR